VDQCLQQSTDLPGIADQVTIVRAVVVRGVVVVVCLKAAFGHGCVLNRVGAAGGFTRALSVYRQRFTLM